MSFSYHTTHKKIINFFQVKTWFDAQRLELIVTVLSAADLPPRANGQYRNPYAKVYLLPDRRYCMHCHPFSPKMKHTFYYFNTQPFFSGKMQQKVAIKHVFVMYICIFSEKSKRRTKTVMNSCQPQWNQSFIYAGIRPPELRTRVLEVTVWDYDRFGSNEFLGEISLDLGGIASGNEEEAVWHFLNTTNDPTVSQV